MTAAAKLLRLEAEATAGDWVYGTRTRSIFRADLQLVADNVDQGDARLIVALRSLARPLARWVEYQWADSTKSREMEEGPEMHPTDALLAAVEAAMATPDAE